MSNSNRDSVIIPGVPGVPGVHGVSRSLSGQLWHWRKPSDPSIDMTHSPDSITAPHAPEDFITQLLLARDIPMTEVARYRKPKLRDFMPNPSMFQDLDKAVVRVANAVENDEKITIFGDYDVDGATSSALLILLLRDLGLAPDVYIPDRLREGYGPSPAAMENLAAAGERLLITVDCGAQAYEALAVARAREMEVIVLDHHQCLETLPEAYAMVNPNRCDESPATAAYGNLAAVGVAFVFAAGLLRTLRHRGFFTVRPEPQLMTWLDLVALGTIADVVALRGFNRALVAQGMKVMAQRGNIGLATLMDVAGLTSAPTTGDVGFTLAPRINAGGRVGQANLGVRLLTSQDQAEAASIAAQLDHFNKERRALEAAMLEEASSLAAQIGEQSVIVIAAKNWHPGIIGIIAGRIKEKLSRPTIVIAIGNDGVGKGSGRSISGVDLGAAILAAKAGGLLLGGGGHAMAAGLSVAADGIGALDEFLNIQLREAVTTARANQALLIDATLAPKAIAPQWCAAVEEAGPFGAGWPAPRIVTGPVRIVESRLVGTDHVRTIMSGDDGARFKAMAFRSADNNVGQALLHGDYSQQFWLVGRVKRDDWGSRPSAEFHIEDIAFANAL